MHMYLLYTSRIKGHVRVAFQLLLFSLHCAQDFSVLYEWYREAVSHTCAHTIHELCMNWSCMNLESALFTSALKSPLDCYVYHYAFLKSPSGGKLQFLKLVFGNKPERKMKIMC